MFVPGKTYIRRQIHRDFGGQAQGGISTPKNHNVVFIFSGSSGTKHGYRDLWSGDGTFFYTGEGQHGDMNFVRGNAAIKGHVETGKDIHLFEVISKGRVRYVGQMIATGFRYETGPDTSGKNRRMIIFELTPLEEFTRSHDVAETALTSLPLAVLREKALADSSKKRTPQERKSVYQARSEAIKLYALRRADGLCEGCGNPAPFRNKEAQPYLEVHHIRRLSDGGPDHPRWVVAICPNCHRRAHYASDSGEFNDHLSQVSFEKETDEE